MVNYIYISKVYNNISMNQKVKGFNMIKIDTVSGVLGRLILF